MNAERERVAAERLAAEAARVAAEKGRTEKESKHAPAGVEERKSWYSFFVRVREFISRLFSNNKTNAGVVVAQEKRASIPESKAPNVGDASRQNPKVVASLAAAQCDQKAKRLTSIPARNSRNQNGSHGIV